MSESELGGVVVELSRHLGSSCAEFPLSDGVKMSQGSSRGSSGQVILTMEHTYSRVSWVKGVLDMQGTLGHIAIKMLLSQTKLIAEGVILHNWAK